jgi:hypothetical protein
VKHGPAKAGRNIAELLGRNNSNREWNSKILHDISEDKAKYLDCGIILLGSSCFKKLCFQERYS